MRRISEALDGSGGLRGDPEVAAWLDGDPAALAYAQDLVRLDEVLQSLGERVPEPDWEALAVGIEARLDDDLLPLPGIDEPPIFAEPSGEAPRRVANGASALPAGPSASVIPLAPRRRAGAAYWFGGLAAAAALGLGVTLGLTWLGDQPSTEVAAVTLPSTGWLERAGDEEAEVAEVNVPAPSSAWAPASAEEPALAEPAPASGELQAPAAAAPPRVEPRPAPAPVAAPMAAAARSAGRGAGRAADSFAELASPEEVSRPSRAEVVSALHSVEPAVQRCLRARGEVARVTLRVDPDGRVDDVRVAPPYAGDELACIATAVRAATLPASPSEYEVAHAYRPAPIAGGSLSGAGAPPAARQRPARAVLRDESTLY